MLTKEGVNYDPTAPKPQAVVSPGEFQFAAAFCDHGHIYGQAHGLAEAGGTLTWVYDPEPQRLDGLLKINPDAKIARSYDEILDDPEVQLVTAAAIPNERAGYGFACLRAGKDYFTDKSPFTTLDQLAEAKTVVAETNHRYMCDYSERLHTEAGWYAGELIRAGAIGDVLQVMNMAPHNLNAPSRPDWFFQKAKYGGILTDIGSHQLEQFLFYAGATGGKVNFARVENFGNPEHPELEDFGEASLTLDNGVSCYCRLDWWNPAGHRTWGDGRTFVVGTKGFLEVRKYNELAAEPREAQVIYLVDEEAEKRIPCQGKVGYPFYGQLILDTLNRTENAMTQAHCFKAAELSMQAQAFADSQRQ